MRRRYKHSFKFYLSLIRHPGTPESVGRGVAVGLFSSFIIPVGHMLMAFLLAILVRGARDAAILSTWIINPLTMPVVYAVQCYIGGFIIGRPLSYVLIKQLVLNVLRNPSFKTAGALSGELIVSFFAGGLIMGAIAMIPVYFLTTSMVRCHRIRRAEKKKLRMSLRKIGNTNDVSY